MFVSLFFVSKYYFNLRKMSTCLSVEDYRSLQTGLNIFLVNSARVFLADSSFGSRWLSRKNNGSSFLPLSRTGSSDREWTWREGGAKTEGQKD